MTAFNIPATWWTDPDSDTLTVSCTKSGDSASTPYLDIDCSDYDVCTIDEHLDRESDLSTVT